MIKEYVGEDGETYYEINGSWFKKTEQGFVSAKRPQKTISCRIVGDKEVSNDFIKFMKKKLEK
jgi:hypothetical protein